MVAGMSVVRTGFKFMTLLDVNEVLPDPAPPEEVTPPEQPPPEEVTPTSVEAAVGGIPVLPIILLGGALLYIMTRGGK